MKVGRLAVLAAVLAVAVLAAPALCEGSDAADGDGITFIGYVADASSSAGITTLTGVSVTLYEVSGTSTTLIYNVESGSDGSFELKYSGTGTAFRVEFDYAGYTVFTSPLGKSSDTTIDFTLSELSTDSEGRYVLSGDVDSGRPIAMGSTEIFVYGYVYGTSGGEEFTVEGATITAVSDSGRSYTAHSNSDGYFEMSVEYGTYTVTVSCSGFQTSASQTYDQNAPIYVTLQENTSGLLWDIDTPHTMMLLGLLMIGIVLLFSLLLFKKSKMPDSEITVVDDVGSLDNPGDDDVGHP
ncbi:MAG: carboxypeptidase-like regulatory domain-containing protein [Thermoplasmata archaeon]|nr:carboxypeptidase-like regulatory domain-containing protein [Thermoplasmata archaeon]